MASTTRDQVIWKTVSTRVAWFLITFYIDQFAPWFLPLRFLFFFTNIDSVSVYCNK
jgi:hypothetical protein